MKPWPHKTLVVGKLEIELREGDYFYDNRKGPLYFKTGNSRVLYRKNFDAYTGIQLHKKICDKLPLELAEKVEVDFFGTTHYKYIIHF